MQGSALRFYMHESQKHGGMLLYEWLLEQARRLGIHGGTAFRAIAGFGRHGVLSEQHFFELAGQMTVLVEFIVADSEADDLLSLARRDDTALFYTRTAAEFGVVADSRPPDGMIRDPR